VAHRPAATLSNVKGKRDAPSLPANVTCLHSTQTNRSEPTMCVSGMPGAQSCKCSCEVTFSQPKHSFVIMVATPFWNSGEVRGIARDGAPRITSRGRPHCSANREQHGTITGRDGTSSGKAPPSRPGGLGRDGAGGCKARLTKCESGRIVKAALRAQFAW
jgi:hypothetical protein